MGVSGLGNVVMVNQNAPTASQANSTAQSRIDAHDMMVDTIQKEKDKLINEVRPTEESDKVNPDKEHQKRDRSQEEEEDEEERKRQKEASLAEHKENNKVQSSYYLDIKV